jgi:peptide chain release factor 1
MEKTYELALAYKKALETERDALDLINNESDQELVAMAQEELDEVRPQIEEFDRQLTIALLPKDPNDDKNIFLEIRPAA